MSSGANKKFLELRERFLEQNVIVLANPQSLMGTAVAAVVGKPDVYDFDLQESADAKFVDAHGAKVKTYRLQLMAARKGLKGGVLVDPKTSAKTRHIEAYYLPWDNNRHYETQLGDDADFMFTPTLDGCSFVVGSGASPKVSHLNYQGANGRIDQARMDANIAKAFADAGDQDLTTLKLDDYSPNSHAEKMAGKTTELTVVGFRDPVGGTWRFYYQKRQREVVPGKPGKGVGVREMLADRLVPIV